MAGGVATALVWCGTAMAVALAYGRQTPSGPVLTGLDLAAGASMLLVGILARRVAPGYAALATATGVLWFAADQWPALALAHRPALLLSALSFPDGRVRRRRDVLLLAAATVAAFWGPRAGADAFWLTLGGATAVVAGLDRRNLRKAAHPGQRARTRAAFGVAVTFALPSAFRLADVRVPVDGLVPGSYSCAVAAVGLVLAAGVVTQRGHTADAVIELTGDDPEATLAALRRESALRGPAHAAALTAAVRLLEDHQRARAELADRVREVRASQQRLIDAEDLERQRLRRLLEGGAMPLLDDLTESLFRCSVAVPPEGAAAATRCLEEVSRTREDLTRFAAGVRPTVLGRDGLLAALEELAGSSPVAFTVRSTCGALPADVEATLYFVCAEAVANAGKHSSAASGVIELASAGTDVVARVRDDGVGGARMEEAGGLEGLRERVAAAGGMLSLTSPPGRGTRIEVRLPCA